ncbi:hypothetical protein BLNAU_19908 [Blattamonas nauphoetae]|uniref:Uncharacterized protein n=1 Tax=Blattamonas nauphoetae TaxID=2049346 RepID=A0ABQ9X081_9EUKA|nr:hypothetical protein BLNAU_19908 [Blattamonas nauphoetae]
MCQNEFTSPPVSLARHRTLPLLPNQTRPSSPFLASWTIWEDGRTKMLLHAHQPLPPRSPTRTEMQNHFVDSLPFCVVRFVSSINLCVVWKEHDTIVAHVVQPADPFIHTSSANHTRKAMKREGKQLDNEIHPNDVSPNEDIQRVGRKRKNITPMTWRRKQTVPLPINTSQFTRSRTVCSHHPAILSAHKLWLRVDAERRAPSTVHDLPGACSHAENGWKTGHGRFQSHSEVFVVLKRWKRDESTKRQTGRYLVHSAAPGKHATHPSNQSEKGTCQPFANRRLLEAMFALSDHRLVLVSPISTPRSINLNQTRTRENLNETMIFNLHVTLCSPFRCSSTIVISRCLFVDCLSSLSGCRTLEISTGMASARIVLSNNWFENLASGEEWPSRKGGIAVVDWTRSGSVSASLSSAAAAPVGVFVYFGTHRPTIVRRRCILCSSRLVVQKSE